MIKQALFLSILALGVNFPMNVYSSETVKKIGEIEVPAEISNEVLGVNLQDLVNNHPKLVNGLANIVNHLKKNPSYFFPLGKIERLNAYFLNEIPVVTGGVTTLNVTAFVKYKNESRFEKVLISYTGRGVELKTVYVRTVESLSIDDMDFTLRVGLVERKIVLDDAKNKVKFVVPIGVGGFDEGVMNEGEVSLITPRFKEGFIDKHLVISKRDKPKYFANKPFIRISKGEDNKTDATPIGFHTEINPSFIRGFDSHGCMRLRDIDLYMLHDLIKDGSRRRTPITVSYHIEDEMDHPAKKRNDVYKTVQNTGTKDSPFFPLDRDDLVQMVYKKAQAPLELLVDRADDHYEDVFDYDTVRQLRDQNNRRKEECERTISTEDKKAFEACMNKGKRKGSASDAIYKWWVH